MNIPASLEARLKKDIPFTEDLYWDLLGRLKSLALKYCTEPNPILFEDLMQEGWIGVSLACDQYRGDKGAALATYAYKRAWAKMQQYMNYKHEVVHIPIAEKANYPTHTVSTWGDVEPGELKAKPYSDKTKEDTFLSIIDELEDGDLLRQRFIEGESVASLTTAEGQNRETINERIDLALEKARIELDVWQWRTAEVDE